MLFTILAAGSREAPAHPVAQGALDIEIASGKVAVQARVSTIEAFVANAYETEEGTGLDAQVLLWEKHGHYLVQHLRVTADDRKLEGRLLRMVPPEGPRPEHLVYELEYDVPSAPGTDASPCELQIEEDVLNEFDSSPGTRWEATFVVRIGQKGRSPTEGLLLTSREPLVYRCESGGEGAGSAAARLDRWRLFRDYLRHGVMHILTGYDHLLFIGALVLATVTLWDLVKIVSAFTLAHTLTLTLAVLDIVRLPGRIVEPIIAASIVFVAVENLLRPERTRGAARMLVAFGFGLFHGLGFAGGLLEAMGGMTGAAVGLAIVAFSAGVELGHQMVVLPIFGLLRFAGRTRRTEAEAQRVHAVAMKYGSLLISGAGLLYLFAALR